jgi:hypothetical protein
METTQDPRDVRQRMNDIGYLLIRLSEHPEVVERLTEALRNGDPEQFRRELARPEINFGPPPELCDPWVTIIVITIDPDTGEKKLTFARRFVRGVCPPGTEE